MFNLPHKNVIQTRTRSRLLASVALFSIVVAGTVTFAANSPTTDPSVSSQALDSSGKTIPTTNYPIPTDGTAIFLSTNGNDLADGKTINTSVRTLNAAVTKAPSGGTVVIRGGVYRDWYNANNAIKHINKSITIQAFPGEKPWFDGTDVVSDSWQQSGNIWVRDWSTPQFCDGKYYDALDGVSPVSPNLKRNSPCTWADSIADPAYPVAGDPQLAFVNGNQLLQKGTLSEVIPNSKTFYYDWTNRKIYVSENPQTNTIELSTRPGAMVLGGAYNFAVKGIGFRRYASQHIGGPGGTVIYVGLGGAANPAGQAQFENLVFTENSGAVLSFSGPKNNTYVNNSVFAFNHGSGISGNGFSNETKGAPNSLKIENSVFNMNNMGMYDTKCTASCGVAGMKLNHMVGFEVRNNIFENTQGHAPGVWCDMDCSNGVIVNNISRNNGGHGIFYEISNKGIIANNLVYNNGGSGIAICAANTKVYNNTVINMYGPNVQAFWIWDDRRVAPDNGQTWPYWDPRVDLGPNTNNVEFANNLIVAQQPKGARLMNFAYDPKSTGAPNTTTDQYFSVLDSNIYYHLQDQNLYMWNQTDAIRSTNQLRSVSGQNWELNTIDVVGSGDPFENRTENDFRIKADSLAATKNGRALPGDVATAIGVPQGAVLSRGAQFPVTSTPTVPSTTVASTTTSTAAPASSTTVKPTTTTAATTTTTTTTVKPATTTTTTAQPSTTTTTVATTTTTTKPTTTTTTTIPSPTKVENPEVVAINKLLQDQNIEKIKVISWNNPTLKARVYFKQFFGIYIIVDISATVDQLGNSTLTSTNWQASFFPFS